MYQLSENEKIIQSIINSSKTFLKKINSAYNRGNSAHKGYVNWYLSKVDFGCRTYVSSSVGWYNSSFYITVDAQDILNYIEKNGVDIETATKLLVSHEIFHILLGHFSSKYKNHNKRILNIAGDLEINQLINLHEPGIQVYDYGYKPFRNTDYYYEQLMAEVEEQVEERELISQILASSNSDSGETGDGSPDTNMEEAENSEDNENSSQSSEEKTSSNNNSENSSDENEDNNTDSDVNNEITIHKRNGETITPDTSKTSTETESSPESSPGIGSEIDRSTIENEVIDELIPEDRQINETTVETMEKKTIDLDFSIDDIIKVENTIKRELSKSDTYEIEGLNEIIRKIINKENSMKITPHGRQASYYKLNNRRKSDFILPGKKLTKDGIKKKFDSSPVVFIDVSGSTDGRVNIDLMNVAKKLHKIGATIVYYNGGIKSVCEPDSVFFTEEAGGGTDITYTTRTYLKNFEPFDRAYVFTDGYDNFSYLKSVCNKFNVFFIQGNRRVFEKYTEKSIIPDRWG